MALDRVAIKNIFELFGDTEAKTIVSLTQRQETIEQRWVRNLRKKFDRIVERVTADAEITGNMDWSWVSFDEFVLQHSLAVMGEGIKSAQRLSPITEKRLARPPSAKIPANLAELRRVYDEWRSKGVLPPRQQSIANRIKRAFFARLQKLWIRYGEDFREGSIGTRREVIGQVMRQADVVFSRAKMITETETTYYYNKSRREIYDKSDDITHYLFMAIRDFRTTQWCNSRQGLVYKKDDPLLKQETPPIHWNCRSEILPLSRLNPRHARIIDHTSRQRRNRTPEPLPAEWIPRNR
jgi:SPP1 gp7 family putative phage head morphogenesis protein